MADDSAEKTEEPTSRRLEKARSEGQLARSIELPVAAMSIGAVGFFTLMGGWLFNGMSQLFVSQLEFDRKIIDKAELLPGLFAQSVVDAFLLILPLMLLMYFIAIASTVMSGGLVFSMGMVAPKFSKLNPLNGLSRIFGVKSLIELAKSIAKFVVVGGILLLQVSNHMEELLALANLDLNQAMAIAGKLIVDACFWLSMGLLLIALADVPIQQYQVHQKLKMSRQEVRDEMKDSEGRPEVKQKIKQRQREMANNRMLAKVKDADVVITNPQHFAVALSYDPNGDGAPILLAKGSDELARRIREEAQAHAVELFPAPELARALYFTTQVDEPIPEGLYHAVAQVIAYVFSLNQSYAAGEGLLKPVPVVPENMRFDSNGLPA
ncbi:MAG: flagellar biosynthesis protein FlhB [Betaproteobacteria bacterium]|nr:flagellar biosynthesis protein FlhB [Betaproteobacteria bacterium]NBY04636.1 flagellar biosynthesis protein FlhB [Betaproteobacteria bacterium]